MGWERGELRLLTRVKVRISRDSEVKGGREWGGRDRGRDGREGS